MTAKTRAALSTEFTTSLPDNTTGAIAPADVRTAVVDLADSAVFPEDALYATAAQGALAASALQDADIGVTGGAQAFDAQLSSVMPRTRNINTSATLALTDGASMVRLSGGTSQTLTIPANATIAFAIGSMILIINRSGNPWSIAIATDTLMWSPSGGTGTRILATNGMCLISKNDTADWMITGVGLT